jgi:hypothetical protein
MNNNSSIKNFNFHEDSKISLIVNVVNTSPSTSVNKNFNSSITPPPELENSEKAKDLLRSKEINPKQKLDAYANNLSKSSKSPYNKDKFLRNIKAANMKSTENISNLNFDNNPNVISNPQFSNNNINAKSLSIISENSTIKRKIFQNNFLAQSKGEYNFPLKENYKSENDFINNINNINRTKTPNTRSLNRDFSENVIYSNKVKPKNTLNYTNRENTMNNNIMSDRDRKNYNPSNQMYLQNTLVHNSGTTTNLHKNTNSLTTNTLGVNFNLDKKQTGNFNYTVKNNTIQTTGTVNQSAVYMNNSTKNNNTIASSGIYNFKAPPTYNNIVHKSINGNLTNTNSITMNNNFNNMLGNNMNLSLNLNSNSNIFSS